MTEQLNLRDTASLLTAISNRDIERLTTEKDIEEIHRVLETQNELIVENLEKNGVSVEKKETTSHRNEIALGTGFLNMSIEKAKLLLRCSLIQDIKMIKEAVKGNDKIVLDPRGLFIDYGKDGDCKLTRYYHVDN